MSATVKDMLAAANAEVPRISADDARRMVAEENAVIIDVRDPAELAASGKIPGSVNIPRGMLEFRADAASQYHDANLSADRPVILHCASGGRSALSGATLKQMGFEKVYNLGGFKPDWVDAGGEVEKV